MKFICVFKISQKWVQIARFALNLLRKLYGIETGDS